VIKIYAAGTSGECSELPGRFSEASDVEELYARHCERFPQLREIVSRVAVGDAEPEALVELIGQTYRSADPSLDAIPQQTDTGYDSWCPRGRASGHEKIRVCGQLAPGSRPLFLQSCGHLRSRLLACCLAGLRRAVMLVVPPVWMGLR
jgi:hypothetical protein